MERMQLLVSKEMDDLKQRLNSSLLRREGGALVAAAPRACAPEGDLYLLDNESAEAGRDGARAIRCDGLELTILSSVEAVSHRHMDGMFYFAIVPMAYETMQQYAKQPSLHADEQDRSIMTGIEAWCLRIGVPAHIQGYQFICEAVRIVYHDPDAINRITRMLYPSIADRFNTSASKVERSIRHAVGVVWKRERSEAINELYGFPVDMRDGKPTNGEFIALLANRCRTAGLKR